MLHNTINFNPNYLDYSADFDLLSLDSHRLPEFSSRQNFDTEHCNNSKLINFLPTIQSNFCQRLMDYARGKKKNHYFQNNKNHCQFTKSDSFLCTKFLNKQTDNVLHFIVPELRQAIQPLLIPYKFLRLYDIIGKGN